MVQYKNLFEALQRATTTDPDSTKLIGKILEIISEILNECNKKLVLEKINLGPISKSESNFRELVLWDRKPKFFFGIMKIDVHKWKKFIFKTLNCTLWFTTPLKYRIVTIIILNILYYLIYWLGPQTVLIGNCPLDHYNEYGTYYFENQFIEAGKTVTLHLFSKVILVTKV